MAEVGGYGSRKHKARNNKNEGNKPSYIENIPGFYIYKVVCVCVCLSSHLL